jgi:hypothetical protein
MRSNRKRLDRTNRIGSPGRVNHNTDHGLRLLGLSWAACGGCNHVRGRFYVGCYAISLENGHEEAVPRKRRGK